MTNENKCIKRDSIHIGEVIKKAQPLQRYPQDYQDFNGNTLGNQLYAPCWVSYRSILFIPNEQKLATDLLYDSPNYPILNVSEEENCKSSQIVITGSYNLSLLLKYYQYGERLSLQDIHDIKNRFFTGHFAKDNSDLFGWHEIMAEEVSFFLNGQEITEAAEIEKERKKFRTNQKLGNRLFTGTGKATLPHELWEILDERGKDYTIDLLPKIRFKRDAFKPPIAEGKIKKLTRFPK